VPGRVAGAGACCKPCMRVQHAPAELHSRPRRSMLGSQAPAPPLRTTPAQAAPPPPPPPATAGAAAAAAGGRARRAAAAARAARWGVGAGGQGAGAPKTCKLRPRDPSSQPVVTGAGKLHGYVVPHDPVGTRGPTGLIEHAGRASLAPRASRACCLLAAILRANRTTPKLCDPLGAHPCCQWAGGSGTPDEVGMYCQVQLQLPQALGVKPRKF
jgi:hypothetical protein